MLNSSRETPQHCVTLGLSVLIWAMGLLILSEPNYRL